MFYEAWWGTPWRKASTREPLYGANVQQQQEAARSSNILWYYFEYCCCCGCIISMAGGVRFVLYVKHVVLTQFVRKSTGRLGININTKPRIIFRDKTFCGITSSTVVAVVVSYVWRRVYDCIICETRRTYPICTETYRPFGYKHQYQTAHYIPGQSGAW